MKEFADDNSKFDENGRKLSKRVENTVRKGEIARYEQFLFFPQCFQRACFPGASKGVILWEWVNVPHNRNLTLSQTSPCFICLRISLENTQGKGQIAPNEQFLLFHGVFKPLENFQLFSSNLNQNCHLQTLSILTW